jgi:hypothetical protein
LLEPCQSFAEPCQAFPTWCKPLLSISQAIAAPLPMTFVPCVKPCQGLVAPWWALLEPCWSLAEPCQALPSLAKPFQPDASPCWVLVRSLLACTSHWCTYLFLCNVWWCNKSATFFCRSCLATHLCQHLKILFRMQTFKPIAQCSWMMFFIWCFKSFKISVVFSWNFIYNYNPHIYIFATIKCSSS